MQTLKIGHEYLILESNGIDLSSYVYIGRYEINNVFKYKFVSLASAKEKFNGYDFDEYDTFFIDINKAKIIEKETNYFFEVKLEDKCSANKGELIKIENNIIDLEIGCVYTYNKPLYDENYNDRLILINKIYQDRNGTFIYNFIRIGDLVKTKNEGGYTFPNSAIYKIPEKQLTERKLLIKVDGLKYKVIRENLSSINGVKLILDETVEKPVIVKKGYVYKFGDNKYVLLDIFRDEFNQTCHRYVELEYFKTLGESTTNDVLDFSYIIDVYKTVSLSLELCEDEVPFEIKKQTTVKYNFREMTPRQITIYE